MEQLNIALKYYSKRTVSTIFRVLLKNQKLNFTF